MSETLPSALNTAYAESEQRVEHVKNNPQYVVHQIANAISILDYLKILKETDSTKPDSRDSALDSVRALLCQAIGIK